MYQDYKDLLSAFHARGVKYVVVGGYAVIYHSQPRFTNWFADMVSLSFMDDLAASSTSF
jgi:hypothetical protein